MSMGKNGMNTSKKVKALFVIAPVLILAFFGWDQYMKTSFDHHMMVSLHHYNLKKQGEDHWLTLTKKETEAFPEKYKKVEIIKKDNDYIWVSNDNQKLTKAAEYRPTTSPPGGSKHPSKLAVYTNSDGSGFVEVMTDLYQRGGCSALYSVWTGNLIVRQQMENGDILISRGHVDVYESLFQYLFCDHYDPQTGLYFISSLITPKPKQE